MPKKIARGNPVTKKILAWYNRNERDLPWRRTSDPYRIWVSEIMLQQTQVNTVIPFYRQFLKRFPTARSLATAPLGKVLKAWENMGYYARARNLHTASKQIVKDFKGKIPDSWDELIQLPGIGQYTAGAILSIAFGKKVPVVDGNVRRLMARLYAVREPLSNASAQRRIRNLAEALLPEKDVGRFNQGLMELGATICVPRNPACSECPLPAACEAHKTQLQNELPVMPKRRPIPHYQVTAGVVRNKKGRLLIVQRHEEGLLGGLWKWPGGRKLPGESLKTCLKRTILDEVDAEVDVGERIAKVGHAYTHFRITLHAFECTIRKGKPKALKCEDWCWTNKKGLTQYAFSKADREVMKVVIT